MYQCDSLHFFVKSDFFDKMKKLLIIIGTRPEAIKMTPVFLALKKDTAFLTQLCLTGQHRELVQEVLDFFSIRADYDLAVMEECKGDLSCLTTTILTKVQGVMGTFRPDCLLVQGDTTSAFAAALAAFFSKTKIGHVEAGLRTFDKENPFPEEFNRVAISRMADFHFAPTETAKQYLIAEKTPAQNILVTGNTVVDALLMARKIISSAPVVEAKEKKILLATIHRRENHGLVFREICMAIREISVKKDWLIVFTLHPNSSIYPIATEMLHGLPNIKLIEPQPYGQFIQLMLQSNLILTDSGGIQEEATVLNKPLLLVREKTERPEAKKAGIVTLVGNKQESIVRIVGERMDKYTDENPKAVLSSMYGDGKASEKIVEFLKGRL